MGILFWLVISCLKVAAGLADPEFSGTTNASPPRIFTVHGVVRELRPAEQIVVIRHEAIPGYMDAMTMPFKAANPADLSGLNPGDAITFHLAVTDNDSHVDDIVKTGSTSPPPPTTSAKTNTTASLLHHHPLLDYKFTNEQGQAVCLNDFRGQALGITFFYTRCPLPDYCPRLSKNFEEACVKLKARPDAPTNWHFISVSFDPDFDTPAMLKAYAGMYQADPARWNFLTGPADKIAELAHQAGVTYQYEDGSINHDFRTLIIDANGHLQMIFPTSGDLSDAIVEQMIKAAAVTNLLMTKK